MTAEYSTLLKEIERGLRRRAAGSTKEVTVIAEKAMIMLRRLNADYFIVLVIKPEGNSGKGRSPPQDVGAQIAQRVLNRFVPRACVRIEQTAKRNLRLPAVFYFPGGVS